MKTQDFTLIVETGGRRPKLFGPLEKAIAKRASLHNPTTMFWHRCMKLEVKVGRQSACVGGGLLTKLRQGEYYLEPFAGDDIGNIQRLCEAIFGIGYTPSDRVNVEEALAFVSAYKFERHFHKRKAAR
jgi:hypothetical protein